MNASEKRRILCERCVLVSGLKLNATFDLIRSILPNCEDGEAVVLPGPPGSTNQSWILKFTSNEDAKIYAHKQKLSTSEGDLEISLCNRPCDIPERWVREAADTAGTKTHIGTYTSPKTGNVEGFTPNPEILKQLTSMGFPQNESIKGLYCTGNQNADWATDWILHYRNQPHGMPMQIPFPVPGQFQNNLPTRMADPAIIGYYPGVAPVLQPNWQFQHLPYRAHQPSIPIQQTGKCEDIQQNKQASPFNQNKVGITGQARPSVQETTERSRTSIKQEQSKEIIVTKLPPETTEDNLRYFFENKRRSGGGDVERVDFDVETLSAVVSFVEDGAVERVLQRLPLRFMDSEIHVVKAVPKMENKKQDDTIILSSEKDIASTCSVEIRGVKPTTQQLTIQYYFEGKKGADEDIENIEFLKDTNTYLITFASEEAVKRLLGKRHVIDDAVIDVRQYVPPPRYPNKALIGGIASNVTKEGLINYLEGRTKLDVENVEFSEKDNEKAIVTFSETIDVNDIQAACTTKPLENTYLTVKPVVVSKCIKVSGLNKDTTANSLEYYFDNKRKSGVEGVVSVTMCGKSHCCLVAFEDPQNAENACKRSHTVDGNTLDIQVFYECLGLPIVPDKNENKETKETENKETEETENKETKINKSPDMPCILVTDIDPIKFNFLKKSIEFQKSLSTEIKASNATIVWPVTNDEIKIECSLTPDHPDFEHIAIRWEHTVKKTFNQLLKEITLKRHFTLRDMWDIVVEKVHGEHIGNTTLAELLFDEETCEIIIVGQDIQVKQISLKVAKIIDSISTETSKTKREVIEEIKLENHKLDILSKVDFPSDAKNNCQDIQVEILISKGVITLKGKEGEVNAAKMKMYELLASIKSTFLGPYSPQYISVLNKSEVKTLLDNKLKQSRNICILDVIGNKVAIYSLSATGMDVATRILQENITEFSIKIEEQNIPILYSKEWSNFIDGVGTEYRLQGTVIEITVLPAEVYVTCTSREAASTIREKIQDFIFENSITDHTIRFSTQQIKYIKNNFRERLDGIEHKLKKNNVTIIFNDDCIIVKGNRKGIKDAMQRIDPIVKSMQEDLKKEEDKPLRGPVGLGYGSVVATFTTDEGQCIMVLSCDITGLVVDAIVSPSDRDLSNIGGLSKIIVEEAGQLVQTECREHRILNGPLGEGEVFVSSPGNLKCKRIIHAVGPVWQRLQGNEDEILNECICEILRTMDKTKFQTVAISALSTGDSRYPVGDATKTIAKAIRGYFRNHPESSVKTIYLCDIAAKTADCFVTAASKFFKTSDRKPVSSDLGVNKLPAGLYVSQIHVVIQDLAQMKVDVLVNTTSPDLQLSKSGAVSASLLHIGGIIIQQECQRKYRNGIQYGDVAITSGGSLQCKYIFHGALPQWERDGSALQVLSQFVTNCLQTAVGQGCQSIAFPSIGTGRLNYPPGQVANEMFNAVGKFYQNYPNSALIPFVKGYQKYRNSALSDVYFVLYHKDISTVKAFQDEEMRRRPRQSNRRKDRL